ncbi:MAG: hypothetical protein AAB691_03385 [Patescibacteria group bacterium]
MLKKWKGQHTGIIEVQSGSMTWPDCVDDATVSAESDLVFAVGIKIRHQGCHKVECYIHYRYDVDVEPYGTYLEGRACRGFTHIDDSPQDFFDAVSKIVGGASEAKVNDTLTLIKDPSKK